MKVMQQAFLFLLLFSLGITERAKAAGGGSVEADIMKIGIDRPASPGISPCEFCRLYQKQVTQTLSVSQNPEVELALGNGLMKLLALIQYPLCGTTINAEDWKAALSKCFNVLYGPDGVAKVVGFQLNYPGEKAIPLIAAMLEPILQNKGLERCNLKEVIRNVWAREE